MVVVSHLFLFLCKSFRGRYDSNESHLPLFGTTYFPTAPSRPVSAILLSSAGLSACSPCLWGISLTDSTSSNITLKSLWFSDAVSMRFYTALAYGESRKSLLCNFHIGKPRLNMTVWNRASAVRQGCLTLWSVYTAAASFSNDCPKNQFHIPCRQGISSCAVNPCSRWLPPLNPPDKHCILLAFHPFHPDKAVLTGLSSDALWLTIRTQNTIGRTLPLTVSAPILSNYICSRPNRKRS